MRLLHLNLAIITILVGFAACADYGEPIEFGKSTLYYKDGVTAEEAQRLGAYLEREKLLTADEQNAVQALKAGGAYVVRFESPEGVKLDDEDFVKTMRELKESIASEVFPGEYVRIQITDENCEPIANMVDFGRRMKFGEADLYYGDGVTEEEAKRFGGFLTDAGYLGGSKNGLDLQVAKAGEGYVLNFEIVEGVEGKEVDDTMRERFLALKKQILATVLPGGKLDVHLTDRNFNLVEVIKEEEPEKEK